MDGIVPAEPHHHQPSATNGGPVSPGAPSLSPEPRGARFSASPVPEPGAASLLLAGLLLRAGARLAARPAAA